MQVSHVFLEILNLAVADDCRVIRDNSPDVTVSLQVHTRLEECDCVGGAQVRVTVTPCM